MCQIDQVECKGVLTDDWVRPYIKSPFCKGGLGYGRFYGSCKECERWFRLHWYRKLWERITGKKIDAD